MNKKTVLAMSISAIALTACGGGGGGNNHQPNTLSTNLNHIRESHLSSKSDLKQASDKDKLSSRGQGVTVLLVDNGVDLNNTGLQGKNVASEMYLPPEGKYVATKETVSSHGTEMAQIILNHAKNARLEVVGTNNESIHRAFYAGNKVAKEKNAEIINNSYSNSSLKEAEKFAKYTKDIETMVKDGRLFVIAAGNSNKETAASAKAANYNESLKDGFIAVGAIDDFDKMRFNGCREIKDFCIIANEDQAAYDSKGQRFIVGGTSSATAQVSGVAAEIKSRFDFMKNKELKDVLFTTAEDRGEKGPDEIYGQGVLDRNKALNGYGRFDQITELNVEGKKKIYYFDNDISGNGGLIKDGVAELVLNGDNSYTGGNNVNKGTLTLNGKNKSDTFVSENAVLAVGDNDTDVTSGSVYSQGTLSAETATDFVINGNLTSLGKIKKSVGSKIDVKGNAHINELEVTGIAKGYLTKSGTQEVLLRAEKITANEDNLKIANHLAMIVSDLKLSEDNKVLTVTSKRNEIGDAVRNQSHAKVFGENARNIDAVLDKMDEIVENGGTLTDKQLEFADTVVQSSNVKNTVYDLGNNHFKSSHAYASLMENNQNHSLLKNVYASDSDNVWLDYNYDNSKINTEGLTGSIQNNSFNLSGVKILDNGFYLFGSAGTKSYARNENMDNRNKSFSLQGNGVDLGMGYNLNGYKISVFGSFDQFKSSKQFAYGAGVGKSFAVNDKWTITPSFNIQNIRSKSIKDVILNEYLTVKDLKQNMLFTNAGADVRYQVNNEFALKADLYAGFMLKGKQKYTNDYTGIVSKHSNSQKKHYVSAGIEAEYKLHNNLNASVSYKHQNGQSFKNNGINLKLNYKF